MEKKISLKIGTPLTSFKIKFKTECQLKFLFKPTRILNLHKNLVNLRSYLVRVSVNFSLLIGRFYFNGIIECIVYIYHEALEREQINCLVHVHG